MIRQIRELVKQMELENWEQVGHPNLLYPNTPITNKIDELLAQKNMTVERAEEFIQRDCKSIEGANRHIVDLIKQLRGH